MKLYKYSFLSSAVEELSLKKSDAYNGATVTSGDTSYGAVTGCFKTKDNKNAMYVVNYDETLFISTVASGVQVNAILYRFNGLMLAVASVAFVPATIKP